MYCSKCGSEIESNAKFCATCGSPINADVNSGYNQKSSESTMMSPATTSVVAYMTWIGFIIALCAGDKNGAKFFLNQALVFNIFCMACIIPVIGWLWAIYMLVCFILGVIWAAEQTEKRLPLIGEINILQ